MDVLLLIHELAMTNTAVHFLSSLEEYEEREPITQESFEEYVLELEARAKNWHSSHQHDVFVAQAIRELWEEGYDVHPEMDCKYNVMALYAKRNARRLYRKECNELKDLATARRKELEKELALIQLVERAANQAIAISWVAGKGPMRHRLQILKNTVIRAGL